MNKSAAERRSGSTGGPVRVATPSRKPTDNAEVTISVTDLAAAESEPKPPAVARGPATWVWLGLVVLALVLVYIEKHPHGGWDARMLNPFEVHTLDYYLKCSVAGSFACASHVVLIPLDTVKVNMQYDPEKYKSFRQAFFGIAAEYGWGTKGLFKGAQALVVSYAMQGVIKFALYEFLKDSFMNFVGKDAAIAHLASVFLCGACIAEIYADLGLCPIEMLKVRMQTAALGTYPTDFIPALRRFIAERRENGFPFGSIEAVWSRQIPYTMAKFFIFETLVRCFYMFVLTQPRASYSASVQLSVTMVSGFLTGLVAALVSHVPDTLFSLKAKPVNSAKSYGQIIRETGLYNLATTGLFMRMIIVGCLTAVQWWTYDTLKHLQGLGTTATLLKADTPPPAPIAL